MTITLKFKSVITTKETYPNAVTLEYVREVRRSVEEVIEDAFVEAMEFEKKLNIKGIVSETMNCLGITFIHDATKSDLMDLARNGICTL